jgi:hypothetical protein
MSTLFMQHWGLVQCNPSKQWQIGMHEEIDGSGWNRLKMELSYYLV